MKCALIPSVDMPPQPAASASARATECGFGHERGGAPCLQEHARHRLGVTDDDDCGAGGGGGVAVVVAVVVAVAVDVVGVDDADNGDDDDGCFFFFCKRRRF